MRFLRWLKETARKALIGLGVIVFVMLIAALSPDGFSAQRQPRYLHDAEAGQCFAVFDHEKRGPEHVAVPCTPEVLNLAKRREKPRH